VDPHRTYSDDPEPGWFDTADDDRGRYPGPPSQRRPYGAEENAGYRDEPTYSGQPRHEDPLDPSSPIGGIGPRSGEPLPPLPDDGRLTEPPWRPSERIDVGTLRRGFGEYDTSAIPGMGPPSREIDPPARETAALVGDLGPPGGDGADGRGTPPGSEADAVPAAVGGVGVYRSRRPALVALLAILAIIFEVPAARVLASAALAHQVDVGGTVVGISLLAALPLLAMGLYGLITGAAGAAPGMRAWTRTPLAYLPVGLALLLCAALAAR
jgi:hypothetical protein